MTDSPASGYQWRIKLELPDGKVHHMCWIDVVDGDFQNLNCVGRLEFRAKPKPIEVYIGDLDGPLRHIGTATAEAITPGPRGPSRTEIT